MTIFFQGYTELTFYPLRSDIRKIKINSKQSSILNWKHRFCFLFFIPPQNKLLKCFREHNGNSLSVCPAVSLRLCVCVQNTISVKVVPLVTLFKNCLRNFDPSKNMAAVQGGFFHYVDFREILL